MKIAIACDHAGFELKDKIISHFADNSVVLSDIGCFSTDSVDYNDYAHKLCVGIQNGEYDLGILVCGTGIGMSMAANKHRGIRAACCSDTYTARLTRMHNNANVLCLGGRVIGQGLACDIADVFVSTSFEGGRHADRIAKMMGFESN